MARIRLIDCDLELFDLALRDSVLFAQRTGVRLAEWDQFVTNLELSRRLLAANPSLKGWWSYLIVIEDDLAVGICGYKGPPSLDGTVEIAYGVAPSHQSRGIATEAARLLITQAFADNRVRKICAHTLPERNASTRVLEKCGLRFVGEVIDVEDGRVWRWETRR